MRKKLLVGLLCVALFAAVASAVYYGAQYRALKRDQALNTTSQAQTILNKVGKLIQLPGKETPSIARVTDKNKLAHEPFFAQAQNNDWLIIYTKAGEAILYRESENKVIAVGPVTISTPDGAATSAKP